MSTKQHYTEEQIRELSQNPYTHSVNANRISFTLEFKEFFAEQMKVKGMTAAKIMAKAGYNPALFTPFQLTDIRTHIREQIRSGEGLKAPRGKSKEEARKAFAEKDLSKQRTDTAIKEMQQRIVQLEAEISFLKKISAIHHQDKEQEPPD